MNIECMDISNGCDVCCNALVLLMNETEKTSVVEVQLRFEGIERMRCPDSEGECGLKP